MHANKDNQKYEPQGKVKGTVKDLFRITLPVMLVLLLVLEVAVRLLFAHQDLLQLTGKKPIKNPMSSWATPHPHALYTALPGTYAENKTVNSHGFISTPELSSVKPKGTTRIIFLGGSSTAGTGFNLADELTWP